MNSSKSVRFNLYCDDLLLLLLLLLVIFISVFYIMIEKKYNTE